MTAKTPTHQGLPEEALREAATKYTRVAVRVLRRNPKGQLASLFTGEKALDDLWTIDAWLSGWTGGGEYRVEVRDPENPGGDYVIPPFVLLIEGKARPANYVGAAHEPAAAPFGGFPFASDPYQGPVIGAPGVPARPGLPPEHPMSNHAPPIAPWAQGLPPEDRTEFERHRMFRYPMSRMPPGATMASDELAVRELAEVKAANAKLQAQLESVLSRLDDAKAEAREAHHRAEMAALTAKIEALSTAKPQEPAKPQGLFGLQPEAIAALAPVLVALIQGRSTAAEQATKMQFESVNALMTATLAQANKEGSLEKLLPTIAPLALPLIQNLLSHKDPEKQAALYEAMAANNLNSISMMAQLVESFATATAGGEEKWYVGVLREALGGVVAMTEKYMTTPGGLPGQAPAPSLPQPTGHMQQATLYRRDAPPPPQANAAVRTVPKEVELLFNFLPTEYRTPEWRFVLQQLHVEPPLPPLEVAQVLAGQIESLTEAHRLPEAFEGFYEAPRDVLTSILERLPVSTKRPAWATEVLELTLRVLVTDNFLPRDVAEPLEEIELPHDDVEDAEVIETTGEDVTHAAEAASSPVPSTSTSMSFGVVPELVRA